MSDVPWARHRRALVLDVCHTRQWVECVGVDTDDGEPAWEAYGLDECGDVIPDRWLGTLCPTALLPDQCPRCYGTGDAHADGCMVAENISRGVPTGWAPFAMWEDPPVWLSGIRLFRLDRENPPNGGLYLCDVGAVVPGRASRLPLIALGPDGPTLSPWSKQ